MIESGNGYVLKDITLACTCSTMGLSTAPCTQVQAERMLAFPFSDLTLRY